MTETTQWEARAKYNELCNLKSFKLVKPFNGRSESFISNCGNIELLYSFRSGNIYWYNIGVPTESVGIEFEDVLDLVSDEIKIELLFNLDLFR